MESARKVSIVWIQYHDTTDFTTYHVLNAFTVEHLVYTSCIMVIVVGERKVDILGTVA